MSCNFTKDPNETLDYVVTWSDFLGADTIATVTWDVPTGLTNVTTSNTTTTATIFISGGTHGQEYIVGCKITTAGSRTAERSFKLIIRTK